MPLGPCVDTVLELDDPSPLLFGRADPDGSKSRVYRIPEQSCGILLQFLDETSCATGSVVRVPE